MSTEQGTCIPLLKAGVAEPPATSRRSWHLDREHVLNPVTALAFFQTEDGRLLLLAGEDVWLKIYHVESSKLLGQVQVFDAQPVHGIHVSPASGQLGSQGSSLLVWGAQSVAALPRDALLLSAGATSCALSQEFTA